VFLVLNSHSVRVLIDAEPKPKNYKDKGDDHFIGDSLNRKLMLALLITVIAPSILGNFYMGSIFATPPPQFVDPAEYGGWMDAKALQIDANVTHLTLTVTHYGNMPNSEDTGWPVWFHLDLDCNPNTGADWWTNIGVDCRIRVYSRGDGLYSDVALSKWNETEGWFDWTWNPVGFKVLYSVGGDYVGVTCPLSSLGLSQSPNFYLKVECGAEINDHLNQMFPYVADGAVNILVDGNPGDWDSISPKFIDTSGLFPPEEFDATAFYTTNNGSSLFQRLDVASAPTNTPIPDLWFYRDTWVYYDTDLNRSSGYSIGGIGADYRAGIEFDLYSDGKWQGAWLDRWNKTTGWFSDYVGSFPAAWNSVFEWSIPLSMLGVSASQQVNIYVDHMWSSIWDYVPSGEFNAYYISRPAIQHFNLIFGSNNVRMIYPSDNPSKPLGCLPAMVSDWLASMAVSTKLTTYTEGLDTDGGFVDQTSGKPVGDAGYGVISFGGPIVNPVVKYCESDGTPAEDRAPIRFHDEGGMYYFQRGNGEGIPGASLPISVIGGGQDMFVIEVFRDGDGRYVMLCYGFGWKGTYAAGKYFHTEIYPNLDAYDVGWIIVKWEDTNGNGFVNNPGDGDTYTTIATG